MSRISDNNNKRIERAFKRLVRVKDRGIERTLRKLMPRVVEYCLEIHKDPDNRHPLHLEIGDTYGWAIVHDGVPVVVKVIKYRHNNEGNIPEDIQQIVAGMTKPGWHAVVVAGMDSKLNSYFSYSYEVRVLDDAMVFTDTEFKNTLTIKY